MNTASDAFERAVAAARIRRIVSNIMNVSGVVVVLYLTICAFVAVAS